MSERGTWITSNIHCEACSTKLGSLFSSPLKAPHWKLAHMTAGYMEAVGVGSEWTYGRSKAFAGSISGQHAEQEVLDFRYHYAPKIVALGLCHPITFAILGDNKQAVFKIAKGLVYEYALTETDVT